MSAQQFFFKVFLEVASEFGRKEVIEMYRSIHRKAGGPPLH